MKLDIVCPVCCTKVTTRYPSWLPLTPDEVQRAWAANRLYEIGHLAKDVEKILAEAYA